MPQQEVNEEQQSMVSANPSIEVEYKAHPKSIKKSNSKVELLAASIAVADKEDKRHLVDSIM